MAKYTVYGLPGVYNATPLSLNDGDGVALAVDSSGRLIISSSGGGFTVDTELPPAATLGDNTANPSAPAVASFNHWFDGVTWDRARGDSTDGLLVNLGANNDVSATDLDIRDLSRNQDSVLIYGSDDGGTTKRVIKTDSGGAIQVDLEVASVTVTSGNITADTELPTAAVLADDTSNPTVPAVGAFPHLWDGGNWDRTRSVDTSSNTAGQGIQGVGLLAAFDDSGFVSTTENNLGVVRMSTNRNLYVTIRDAAGNERGLNIDASGQLAITVASIPSHAVTNAGTFAVQSTPVTQADTFMLGGVNIKEINAVAPLMGNGTTGTGSQRVTIASDNTAFAVNATLSAETTKVIGVTRTADGAGNLLTSNSTTYTAKFGLDNNLLGTLGTAFSTAGKVDVKGADGDVFVRQTTSSNLNADVNLKSVAGTGIVTGGTAGSQSVGGIVANNGTINSAVNPILVGGQAVSSENAAGTTAKLGQFVTDLVGKLIVLPYANPENFVSGAITSAMTGTTTTSLVAAPASGLRNYITQITVSNAHATVGTDVIIQDGSGGTTLYTIPAAAVYGGATLTFPVPLRQPTTATAIFCANVTTGASTKVSASGYKGI